MDGKSVNSAWGKLHDPILIAVSVWPIVFAAVVAQAFKTYATFRVERGIKLMELEQLVGSNSFGSVMKQPFLLRRLDFLTLLIFLTWCLSPIGSQALQRVYGYERGIVNDLVPAYYGNTVGVNQLFGSDSNVTYEELGNLMQMASVYYISSFMPMSPNVLSAKDSALEDQYDHPLNFGNNSNYYGIPTVLPPSFTPPEDTVTVSGVLAPFETFKFNATSSNFVFTCGNWRKMLRSDLNDNMTFSLSQTLGVNMSGVNEDAPVTKLAFATLTDAKGTPDNATSDDLDDIQANPGWGYSYIECDFQQQFFQTQIQCSTDVVGQAYVPNCLEEASAQVDASAVPKEWYTNLYDFSYEFVTYGNPFAFSNITTPSKLRPHSGHGSRDVVC